MIPKNALRANYVFALVRHGQLKSIFKSARALVAITLLWLISSAAYAVPTDYDIFIGSEYWVMQYNDSQLGWHYKPLVMAIEMRKNINNDKLKAGFRVYSGRDGDFHTDYFQLDLSSPIYDDRSKKVTVGVVWKKYLDRVTGTAAQQHDVQDLGLQANGDYLFSPMFSSYAKLFWGLLERDNSQNSWFGSYEYDLGLGLYCQDLGDALFTLGYRKSVYRGGNASNDGVYIQANILIQ